MKTLQVNWTYCTRLRTIRHVQIFASDAIFRKGKTSFSPADRHFENSLDHEPLILPMIHFRIY